MADFMTSMAVRTTGDDDSLAVHIVEERGNKLSSTRSFNNRLVVEAYQKTALQTTVSQGFAYVQQKITVKGLQVLMDAKLADGTFVPKGSIAYIREELLHTGAWAQKVLEADTFDRPFIIVDMANVEYIVPPTSGDVGVMEPQLTNGQILIILGLGTLWVAFTLLKIYGIYTSFIKKWYLGAAALLVPGFAFVVGIFKLFKKDILS